MPANFGPQGGSSSSSGNSGGIIPSFTFQPGGVASANNYTDWPTLYADLIKISGYRTVLMDDTLATITIPSGTYNLNDVEFVGHTNTNDVATTGNALVTLANGCVFTGFPDLFKISLVSNSNSPVITYTAPTNIAAILLDNLSTLSVTTTSEMIKANGNLILLVIVKTNAGINASTTNLEVFNIINGADLFIYLAENSTLQANTVKGDAGSSLFPTSIVGSATIFSSQPNFAGTIASFLNDKGSNHGFGPTSSSGLTASTVSAAIDEVNTPRFAKYDSLSNVTTGETTLMTKAMPAGDLKVQYDGYFIRAGGSFAATVNTKEVRLYYGATVIGDTGAVILNNGRWWVEARVFRNAATTQVAISDGSTTLAALASFSSRTTPAETLANAITIKVTGQSGSASNDITQDFMDIQRIHGVS